MPIPASHIVEVNPRLISSSGDNLEFNGLILSKHADIPANAVLSFSSPASVEDYFGATSVEAKLAQIYFLGYTNSFKKPSTLHYAARIDSARPAFLYGAKISQDISKIKGLTSPRLEFSIMGKTLTTHPLGFSQVNTWSDIAEILTSAINALAIEEKASGASVDSPIVIALEEAKVEYVSYRKAFKITSAYANEASSISFATNILAQFLALDSASGAILSQGSAALSEHENMELLLRITQNWVNFTTAWLPSKEEVLALAAWANSKDVAYLFLYADDDIRLLEQNSTETIAFALQEAELSSVAGQYNNVEYCAFIMGIGACIDYNRTQGSITAAFKAQSGLPASVTDEESASALLAQGMNFVGDYATRNDSFTFNYPGQMFGNYKWIDVYWNAIWLNNSLQLALLSGLSNSSRTPYSQQGYTLVRAWMQDPINQALQNGVIEAGISLSEAQKAQVNREAGKNIADEIMLSGYYVQVEDPGANARTNRESPIVNLWYSYGGSINKLVLASSALV